MRIDFRTPRISSVSPVCQAEYEAIHCGENPAGEEGEDDSLGCDDGVVLEGGGDVEEPVSKPG